MKNAENERLKSEIKTLRAALRDVRQEESGVDIKCCREECEEQATFDSPEDLCDHHWYQWWYDEMFADKDAKLECMRSRMRDLESFVLEAEKMQEWYADELSITRTPTEYKELKKNLEEAHRYSGELFGLYRKEHDMVDALMAEVKSLRDRLEKAKQG